jgi:hypothetical protein
MRLTILGGASRILAVAALAACGTGPGSDELDIDTADGAEGLRASTTALGERIEIRARVVREAATTPDGEPYEEEVVLASIVGQDGTVYADLRHTALNDDLTGTIAGQELAGVEPGPARRAATSWAELAASRSGQMLGEVSRQAAAALDSGDFPEVEGPLGLVAETGPYLLALGLDDDFGQCGDGKCSVAEDDQNCPGDCGCAAEQSCGGVAPFGCYCDAGCDQRGDCCADSCETCAAGCPPCDEQTPCSGGCEMPSNVCDGAADCPAGQDEAQCSPSCGAGEMACDDGTCIGIGHWCDGKDNCAGGEDELCTCAFCAPS